MRRLLGKLFLCMGLAVLPLGVVAQDQQPPRTTREAAEAGDTNAQFEVGNFYYSRADKEREGGAQARHWLGKAAEAGHAVAQARLGVLYDRGWGGERDDALAVQWYTKAAAQGDHLAEYNLGLFYEAGRHVNKDVRRAADLFEKASNRPDYTRPQFHLGHIHELGLLGKVDLGAAADWYRRAAERGDPNAQFRLAKILERIANDNDTLAQAVSWYKRAAEKNIEGARAGAEALERSLKRSQTKIPPPDGKATKFPRPASADAREKASGNADAWVGEAGFAVNLGRFVNLQCNILDEDDRREFEWRVAVFNTAHENRHGRKVWHAQIAKARAEAAQPPYASCKQQSARAIADAISLLKRQQYKNLRTEYSAESSYRVLLTERLKRSAVGLLTERQCVQAADARKLAAAMDEVKSMAGRYLGEDAVRKVFGDSEHEFSLLSNPGCDSQTARIVAEAEDVLRELGMLLRQDLNLIPRGEGAAAKLQTVRASAPFPPILGIDVGVDDKGMIQIAALPPYDEGSRQFLATSGMTLAGKRTAATPVALVMPRDGTVPLGTVFKKAGEGFGAEYDKGPAGSLKEQVASLHIPAAAFSAAMLVQSIQGVLKGGRAAEDGLRDFLANGQYKRLDSYSIFAAVEDVQIDYLPEEATRKIVQLARDAVDVESKDFYLVADMIVRARKIAYIIAPYHVGDRVLDRKAFEAAFLDDPDVSKRNGAYVITRVWTEPRIVGVGYSVLGVTKVGRGSIPFGVLAVVADAVHILSKEKPGLLAIKP